MFSFFVYIYVEKPNEPVQFYMYISVGGQFDPLKKLDTNGEKSRDQTSLGNRFSVSLTKPVFFSFSVIDINDVMIDQVFSDYFECV